MEDISGAKITTNKESKRIINLEIKAFDIKISDNGLSQIIKKKDDFQFKNLRNIGTK